ncbi:hypothetical protein [Parabacteroides sp. Marseille-P3160]|uniref:hypothetical protein n=1 Tax=Parabacteroides sp. Marseille-P3160 TaxID=1917887 RepID=UPI0011193EAD|nr:hypothetical protein [Parabacteroides sp. Marseille-P3160]
MMNDEQIDKSSHRFWVSVNQGKLLCSAEATKEELKAYLVEDLNSCYVRRKLRLPSVIKARLPPRNDYPF